MWGPSRCERNVCATSALGRKVGGANSRPDRAGQVISFPPLRLANHRIGVPSARSYLHPMSLPLRSAVPAGILGLREINLCDFCNAWGFFFGGHSAGRIFRFDVTDLLQRMYYSVWGCLQ
jgi:hypothetical protein